MNSLSPNCVFYIPFFYEWFSHTHENKKLFVVGNIYQGKNFWTCMVPVKTRGILLILFPIVAVIKCVPQFLIWRFCINFVLFRCYWEKPEFSSQCWINWPDLISRGLTDVVSNSNPFWIILQNNHAIGQKCIVSLKILRNNKLNLLAKAWFRDQ
jgi:hypothetical protein